MGGSRFQALIDREQTGEVLSVKDLQRMGLTWEEAEVAALDRQEWCRNVAQSVHIDVRLIKCQARLTQNCTQPQSVICRNIYDSVVLR